MNLHDLLLAGHRDVRMAMAFRRTAGAGGPSSHPSHFHLLFLLAVINSVIAGILSVVFFAAARVYLYTTFFKLFSLTVVLAGFHAVFVLPALLVLVLPNPYSVRLLPCEQFL